MLAKRPAIRFFGRKSFQNQRGGCEMLKRESKRQRVIHKLQKLAASTSYPSEAETARAKAAELQIHVEHVQVAPVNVGRDDPGTIAIGHWFLEGDAVVICDSKGEPKHHRDIGTRVVPLPDQNARLVARRLIKELNGPDPGRGDFYRPLRYSSKGIV
jgi:hypothetical protein